MDSCRFIARLLPVVAASLLCACASGISSVRNAGDSALDTLSRLGGSKKNGNPFIPNQVAGGDANDPGLRGRRGEDNEPLDREEVKRLMAERRQQGDVLWDRAGQVRDPSDAAEMYNDFAAGVPEHPRAAEAKYRQGRRHFDAAQYESAFESLKLYMRIAPVNPHLKEVEELIYQSGIRHLRGTRTGVFGGAFKSDDAGLSALDYVASQFPAGDRADDSLLALSRYYQKKRDWDASVLRYKELLLRYPDSEWSFLARIGLGDVFLERDQGEPYHAGYINHDPREKMKLEQAKQVSKVRSAGELALEQYEYFLRRIEADPGRKSEYARHVNYVEGQVRRVRAGLAQKDRRTADWYASQGHPQAACLYRQSAQRWLAGRQSVHAATEIAPVQRAPVATPQPIQPMPQTTPYVPPVNVPQPTYVPPPGYAPQSVPQPGYVPPPAYVPPAYVPPAYVPPSSVRQIPVPQPTYVPPPSGNLPGMPIPPPPPPPPLSSATGS